MSSRFPRSKLLPLLFVAVTGSLAAVGRAQALPPSAALEWRNPELTRARQLVSRLEAESGRRIGFESRLDPQLRFREYPGDGAAGEWNARLGVNAAVDFGDPPDTRARTLQSLERARRQVELITIEGTRDALLAHANLLVEQEREAEARAELEEREAEARADSHERRESDVSTPGLGLRVAEFEHREALFELSQARSEARAYGLAGAAVYDPLRFVLPGPDIPAEETHDYRMLRLELLEAEAELAEALRSPLDDLRLRTGYRLPGVEAELEGGLLNGRPGATVALDLPGGVERWEVEVSAQLVLTDNRVELERLEAAVEAARVELEAYPLLFTSRLSTALAGAALAEEALDLAEEEVSSGSSPTGLYRAWIAYIRSVARVLVLSGEEWSARAR